MAPPTTPLHCRPTCLARVELRHSPKAPVSMDRECGSPCSHLYLAWRAQPARGRPRPCSACSRLRAAVHLLGHSHLHVRKAVELAVSAPSCRHSACCRHCRRGGDLREPMRLPSSPATFPPQPSRTASSQPCPTRSSRRRHRRHRAARSWCLRAPTVRGRARSAACWWST